MFSESLRKLRLDAEWTQKELADKAGMSKSAISMLENGSRSPSYETLELFADIFNVDMNTLTGNGKDFDVFALPGIMPPPQTTRKPRLGAIACGQPILAVENIEGYDDVPTAIHCDFTLACKGDSMIGARIHDGDVVYIRQQSEIENGQIAAVLIDGAETTLKRVYVSDGMVSLVAENPAYPPIVITKDRQFTILGKAVGFTSIIK